MADRLSRNRQILLLLGLGIAIYAGSAFSPALQDDADAAHAEAAKEIIERNDWVTLHINGIRYLEKAPLMYWMVAVSYRLLGVSEFSTRLPLALASIGLAFAAWGFARWAWGSRTGFYAGIGVLTSVGIYLFTRILIPEVLLALFLTLAFYFFLRAYLGELNPNLGYPAFFACVALAVLTKGLIGMIFPFGTVGLFLLLTGGWRRWRQMRLLSGSLLFLALAAPWHILAGLRNEGFFWFYFVNEHFLRYLGKRYPPDYDTVPLIAFWGLHLVWMFPWSFFLPLALPDLARTLRALSPRLWSAGENWGREQQVSLLVWIWFLLVLAFFSFSTRQEYYTYPAFPALILLLARGLGRGEERNNAFDRRWLRLGHIGLAAVGVLACSVLAAALWASRSVTPTGDITSLLTENPDLYRLSMGHLFDLTTAAFAELRFPAATAAVVLLAGLVGAALLDRFRPLAARFLLALTMACFIYAAHNALGVFTPLFSSKKLAQEIQARWEPGDLVVINGEYQGGSSLGFYIDQRPLLLNGRMTGLEFGSHFPDAPPIFLEDADIRELWSGPQRLFLFTYEDQIEDLQRILPAELIHPLVSYGRKAILTNRP